MTAANFPRILFVTPFAFNHVGGCGVTYSNLFGGWPKERLATVHDDFLPVTTDVCDQYFHLGEPEIAKWWPLRPFIRMAGETADAGAKPSLVAGTANHGRLRRAKNALFGQGLPEDACLTPELEQWIAEFKPDVLFTLLGSNGKMALIEKIRQRFRLPVVVHMIDDWPAEYYRNGLLSRWQRGVMNRWLDHFFAIAAERLSICDDMSQAYRDRYGHDFVPIHNAADLERWAQYRKTDGAPRNPAEILYVGALLPGNQLESVIDICHAVAKLNGEGRKVIFTIAGPQYHIDPARDRLAIHDAIRLQGIIDNDDAYFAALGKADILLLPANFEVDEKAAFRFSMPTKVPSYMNSRTPVLLYGPDFSPTINYAKRDGWGYCATQRGVEEAKIAIRALLTDIPLRGRLSARALELVAANHDLKRVRQQFRNVLGQAAETGYAG